MGLNVYASLTELKNALAITAVTDESFLIGCLRNASRLIDRATGRTYYPEYVISKMDGAGSDLLWLDRPLLDVIEVALSSDLGTTYTALAAGDYWKSNGARYDETPYQLLVLNPNGSYASWYGGRQTVRITGIWGWRPDYASAWEDSADTVLDTPSLTAVAATIKVASATGTDALGLSPRCAVGNLIKIDSEICEATVVASTQLTVTRGQNGTTAASHTTGTKIYRWRPFEAVEQAALTQAARFYKRAQQAYADAGANMELGRLVYAKRLDPDVEVILLEAGLKRLTVG